jgi:hypothetical protein
MTMATRIPNEVVDGLAAKLDTLQLTDEEHAALGVLLAAGLESGRERPEVEGFMPTAVEVSPTLSFKSQLSPQQDSYGLTFQSITVTNLTGGTSAVDDWGG